MVDMKTPSVFCFKRLGRFLFQRNIFGEMCPYIDPDRSKCGVAILGRWFRESFIDFRSRNASTTRCGRGGWRLVTVRKRGSGLVEAEVTCLNVCLCVCVREWVCVRVCRFWSISFFEDLLSYIRLIFFLRLTWRTPFSAARGPRHSDTGGGRHFSLRYAFFKASLYYLRLISFCFSFRSQPHPTSELLIGQIRDGQVVVPLITSHSNALESQ